MGLIDEEVEIDGKKHKIVQLTLDNVARVEAMISSDSKYRNASDDTKKIEYNKKNEIKYIGSSSYWLKQLKELYDENKKQSNEGYSFDNIIENIIISIDNENITHLNSDGCGREAVKSRIIEVKDKLMDYLEKPTCNNYELINIIKTPTNNTKEEEKKKTIIFLLQQNFVIMLVYIYLKEKRKRIISPCLMMS